MLAYLSGRADANQTFLLAENNSIQSEANISAPIADPENGSARAVAKSLFDAPNAVQDNRFLDAEAEANVAAGHLIPHDVVGDRLQGEATDESDEQGATALPRHSRRLSDKIIIAVHHSCDQGDIEVAWRLLDILDVMTRRPTPSLEGGERRRIKDNLVAAHERLWEMRHAQLKAI
jgi:hypothetical protein